MGLGTSYVLARKIDRSQRRRFMLNQINELHAAGDRSNCHPLVGDIRQLGCLEHALRVAKFVFQGRHACARQAVYSLAAQAQQGPFVTV